MGQILVLPVTQLLGSKWLNYFSRCTEREIESFWPTKLSQILVPPVTQLLGSKWLNFSLGALSEKIESFWNKKLGLILVPLNDSIFLLFDLKRWVTWVETKTCKLKKNIYCIGYPTGSLVLLLKLLISKICTSKLLLYKLHLKWFWKLFDF